MVGKIHFVLKVMSASGESRSPTSLASLRSGRDDNFLYHRDVSAGMTILFAQITDRCCRKVLFK